MGLDCTAYRQLVDVGERDDENDYANDRTSFYAAPGYADRMGQIKEGRAYTHKEEFGFRAGSYSGYNRWREWLSRMALGVMPEVVWNAPQEFAGKPFVELIEFSDCEGTLGAAACAKLAKDFETFTEQAQQAEEPYNAQKFAEWQKACTMAADGGAIAFH